MKPKRMHPMEIVFSFITAVRNSIFVPFYLFIIHYNDVSTFLTIGRIAFFIFLLCWLVTTIINWWKTTYEIKAGSIHIYRGLFTKKNKSVPLDYVQNVQRNTPFLYRMFDMTALSLETSSTDEAASIKFKTIKKEEARRIEQLLDNRIITTPESKQMDKPLEVSKPNIEIRKERTIHFNPTRKELFKASFLSLGFLVFVPVLATIYHEIDNIVNLDKEAEGVITFITSSWLIIGMVITLLVILSIAFGIIRTFFKYGNYEISSDEERIYIHNGVLNEKSFSIRKENVQAIQVIQTPFKKIAGLSRVKLISAGSGDDESEEIDSLYPFLSTDQAYNLLIGLLPGLKIEQSMNKLPRKALFTRMLRIPWLWIVATILIFWLKPEWWYVSPILFVLTYVLRIFDYRNTRFLVNKEFIQFKTGGLWSTLFVTNRKKVIEIEVEQTILQKKIGLATINTINRTKPVHLEQLKDITFATSHQFIVWYRERRQEIRMDQQSIQNNTYKTSEGKLTYEVKKGL